MPRYLYWSTISIVLSPIWKTCWVRCDLPRRKCMHLDFDVLMITLHFWHHLYSVSNIVCKLSSLSDIKAISSAYTSNETLTSPIAIPRLRSLISRMRSSANTENSVGDKLQPCLTPVVQLNEYVLLSLILIHKLVLAYIYTPQNKLRAMAYSTITFHVLVHFLPCHCTNNLTVF